MTRLCQLAARYGTDKAGGDYTAFYDSILHGRDIRTVLEIGIGTVQAMSHVPGYIPGASLRMWKDYFPQAEVYGVDIEPTVLINEPRIKSRLCNQSNPSDLIATARWIDKPIDLIVDDGDHQPKSQITSLITLMPYLSVNGLYIIEDVDNLEALSQQLPFHHTMVTFKRVSSRQDRLILIPKQDIVG